jgi:carboxylesterase
MKCFFTEEVGFDMNQIIPTAEPFFLPGTSRKLGCLLVHGFTGTPKEMRWMGEYLSSQGYPSLGVRLAGHATQPRDMIRARYPDWIASVEDGYAMLREWTPNIVLVGLSMGGALSLLCATRLKVAGVLCLSTPFELPPDPRLRFINEMSFFKPFIPKSKLPPGSGWFDIEAWKSHVAYPENPVRGIGELNKLLAEMRLALPQVRIPVRLIHSRQDSYVLSEHAEKIYSALGTADKQILYVNGSGHVVTRDAARQQVFELALQFIKRVGSQI